MSNRSRIRKAGRARKRAGRANVRVTRIRSVDARTGAVREHRTDNR